MKKFEELQYGDIIQWKMFPLYTLLIVSFTVGTDEPIFQELHLEKYWEDDVSVQSSYKVILRPLDKSFAKESFYVMDFKTMYNNQFKF